MKGILNNGWVWGNFLLAGCCVCYLMWWLLAFKPGRAVQGARYGSWLIGAAVMGTAAVVVLVKGIQAATPSRLLFPAGGMVIFGIVLYLVLLFLTSALLHRVVTTELFLIVGWGLLAAEEMNALYGIGLFSKGESTAFLACILVIAAVSLFCYLQYYKLDAVKGYIAGMMPLILVLMESMACGIAIIMR